jgi:hypothetical protein
LHVGGQLPELLWPRHGHRWVRMRVKSTLVALAWSETSPSVSSRRRWSPLSRVYDRWGLRSHCQPPYAVPGARHHVDLALLLDDLKRI